MARPTRVEFRKGIEGRLRAMGISAAHWYWQDRPARLIVIRAGETQTYHINATVALATVESEMRVIAQNRRASRKPVPVRTMAGAKADRQLDIEDAIAERGH